MTTGDVTECYSERCSCIQNHLAFEKSLNSLSAGCSSNSPGYFFFTFKQPKSDQVDASLLVLQTEVI